MSSQESLLASNGVRARTPKLARSQDESEGSLDSSSPLRIAIIGGGRIGSAFAFYLIRNGHHDVTIVARPNSTRLKQLERDCGVISSDGLHAPAKISDSFDEQVPYDLVLVTVLAHQVEALLPSLRRSHAKSIHFLFNTFDPEHVRQAVGPDRAVLGLPFIQSNVDARGRVTITVREGGQQTLTSNPKWANVFRASGLPAKYEGQMALWLRCHAPLCVAFESISVAGVRRGGGGPWNKAYTLAVGIRACFKLIRSQGDVIYPRSKAWIGWLPVTLVASMLWVLSRITSFRELLATGENECCALVDTMVASGEKTESPAELKAILAMKP